MKKVFIIITVFIVALTISSCDKTKNSLYGTWELSKTEAFYVNFASQKGSITIPNPENPQISVVLTDAQVITMIKTYVPIKYDQNVRVEFLKNENSQENITFNGYEYSSGKWDKKFTLNGQYQKGTMTYKIDIKDLFYTVAGVKSVNTIYSVTFNVKSKTEKDLSIYIDKASVESFVNNLKDTDISSKDLETIKSIIAQIKTLEMGVNLTKVVL